MLIVEDSLPVQRLMEMLSDLQKRAMYADVLEFSKYPSKAEFFQLEKPKNIPYGPQKIRKGKIKRY